MMLGFLDILHQTDMVFAAEHAGPNGVTHQLTADIEATLTALMSDGNSAALSSIFAAEQESQADQRSVLIEANGMLNVDAEMAGLLSAADDSSQQPGTLQPMRLTADIDATLAELTSTAVAAVLPPDIAAIPASSAAQEIIDSGGFAAQPSGITHYNAKTSTASSQSSDKAAGMLDMNAEMSGLVPPEHIEPAVHAMLSLDEEMAGLSEVADATPEGSDQKQGQISSPPRLTASVDATLAELTSTAVTNPPLVAADTAGSTSVETERGGMLSLNAEMSGLTAMADAALNAKDHKQGECDQPERLTADIDDTLADLSFSAMAANSGSDADHVAPASVENQAERDSMLSLDAEMSGLTEMADTALDAPGHQQDLRIHASRLTADVDATLADLSLSAMAGTPEPDAATAASLPAVLETEQVAMLSLDAEMSGLMSAADGVVDESGHQQRGEAQPSRLTADVDDMLEEVSSSAAAAVLAGAQADAVLAS